ncbi:MAG: class I SAM-dependent methyltransferase [Pirellulaceae bacterium]
MRPDLPTLYRKYADELYSLSRTLRCQYHDLLARGFRATFGDVEGEVLYMLLREARPGVVFEISPDCGWSTNYILAALSANQSGVLHSFELAQQLNGVAVEQAIRSNLHPAWDQHRLVLHIGDARETTARLSGPIDFLFLDSCHEAFFAEWYIDNLFPRVEGWAFVQDIAFEDALEPSGEARYFWEWAHTKSPALQLVGAAERTLRYDAVRRELSERRGLRCNSVYFPLPIRQRTAIPELVRGPQSMLQEAEAASRGGQPELADRLLNTAIREVMAEPGMAHRHRLLLQASALYRQLGELDESDRCCQRALGTVLESDKFQRRKGLRELTRAFRKQRKWRFALTAWSLRLLESVPRGARRTVRPWSAPAATRNIAPQSRAA